MPQRPLKPCAAPGCGNLIRGARHCDKHQHLSAAWANSQRASKGVTGRPWRRLRDQIMERDGHLCRCDECTRLGRTRLAHEVDHIVPLADGGTDDPRNLRAINRDCHKLKTQVESAAGRGVGRNPERSRPDTVPKGLFLRPQN
jgi:5-methylcytosine-specific restriction enzyme A